MNYKIVTKTPEIHSVPLSNICINDREFFVEFDDISEQRWRMDFKTNFAWKSTCVDYLEINPLLIKELIDDKNVFHSYVVEVIDSIWLNELKQNYISSEEQIIDQAHHYLLFLDENLVEVLAFDNYSLELITMPK
jgi:hypothetical protein